MRYDLDGADLWVHKQVLKKAKDSGFMRFYFGLLGWCRVELAQDRQASNSGSDKVGDHEVGGATCRG